LHQISFTFSRLEQSIRICSPYISSWTLSHLQTYHQEDLNRCTTDAIRANIPIVKTGTEMPR